MSNSNPNLEQSRSDFHPHGRNPDDFDRAFFRARLTPFRSLPRPGFLALVFFVGVICSIQAMFFIVIGAWPVSMFFGLDAFLILGAFWLSYRDGRRYEDVTVSPANVTITSVSPSHMRRVSHFNPAFTRLCITRVEDEGVTGLELRQRHQVLEIGGFLNPEDRETFARAFGDALAKARVGGAVH